MAPIPAATVVLLREDPVLEVFLVRRHRASTFMSSAYVFPGGKVDPGEASVEVAAVRELFEEAGVLLAAPPADPVSQALWRGQLNAGTARFADLPIVPDLGALHWFANWITPSVEPKRFDAQFFIAVLPPGQSPSYDEKETTEGLWITPAEALRRHTEEELRLPPPQLRTLFDLERLGTAAATLAHCRERAADRVAILPRLAEVGEGMALLLPWDHEYDSRGQGEALAITSPPYLSNGPSRFLLQGTTWRMM